MNALFLLLFSKKPQTTYFKKEWCADFDFVRPSSCGPGSFFCLVCSKNISCLHMGVGDIPRHMKGAKHMSNKKEIDMLTQSSRTMDAFVEKKDNPPLMKKVALSYICSGINIVRFNLDKCSIFAQLRQSWCSSSCVILSFSWYRY